MVKNPIPSVYAVVLNFNGLLCTERCVESLLCQNYSNFKVLLVDNGSTDGSFEQCKTKYKDAISFLDNGANYYFAKGNNLGIQWALEQGADYVFVVNNDTELSPTCVSELVAFMMETPEAGGCQPLLMKMGDDSSADANWSGEVASAGVRVSLCGRCWDHSMGQRIEDIDSDSFSVSGVTGGAMFLPADVLKETKGFDESFIMYFEDVDLSFRIRNIGRLLFTVPKARMGHFVGKTTKEHAPLLRIQRCEANSYRLIVKHFPRSVVAKALLASFIFSAGTSCCAALRADFAKAGAIFKGAAEGLLFCIRSWRQLGEKEHKQSVLKNIDTSVWFPPSC